MNAKTQSSRLLCLAALTPLWDKVAVGWSPCCRQVRHVHGIRTLIVCSKLTYLSHDMAVKVNTEAEMDRMAMKFEILQYISPNDQ